MLSPRFGEHVTRSLKHEAESHVFFQEMSEPSRKRVRTLKSFSLPHEAPLRQRFYKNNTEVSSNDGEQIKGKEVTDVT